VVKKYVLLFLFICTLGINNIAISQAVIRNHDIDLGPDVPFCESNTFVYNPFLINQSIATSCSYTQSVIPYTPESYTTGTAMTGLSDDCFSNNFPIGFDFYFFGVSYNYYRMSTNAIITPSNPPQNPNATNFPQGGGCSSSITGCEGSYAWNLSGLGSLGQATNTLPKNSIFFGGMDLLPTTGGTIKYQLTGVAPFRKLTIKYKDVPYFSCTTQLFNGQLMLYETTNIIEVHILKKQTCTWNSNSGVIGLQGQFPNQFSTVTGYNNQSFQFTTSKAWRFTPSGTVPPPANLPITIKWKQLPNGPITYGQSINIVPQVGVSSCYTAQIVRNNTAHSTLGCGSNTTPDTVCFYPSFINTIPSSTNLSCYNVCSGTATINAIYGFHPWTYYISYLDSANYLDSLISTQDTSHTFSNLCAGTYLLSTSDSLGCLRLDTVVITQPDSLSFTYTKTNISCFGNSTGTLTIDNPTGGIAPYLYSINGLTYTSNQTYSGLAAGNYTMYVKDSNGCIKTIATAITQPTLLTLSSSQVNVLCYGDATGSITLTGQGGTPIYTYTCGSQTNSTGVFTSLLAGSFSCNVQDDNGCVSTANITITQPTAPLSQSITSQTNVLCNGGSNASIVVHAAGGTSPYTFAIPTGVNAGSVGVVAGANATFSNLASATFNAIITDNNSCTISVPVVITQPSALNLIIDSIIDVFCFGNSTGKICVKGTGAVSPYSFVCSNVSGYISAINSVNNNCFTGLSIDSYNVLITDANNCTSQQTAVVSQPLAPLDFTITSVSNVLCNGGSSGIVDILAIGGTNPYTYNISPFSNYQSSLPLSGLSVGSHLITVKDSKGCIDTTSVYITEPPLPLGLTLDSITNISCNGLSNGCIYVQGNVGTGTPPYTYSLTSSSSFTANSAICGLNASNYTVYIKDSNGCLSSIDTTLTEPNPLQALLTTDSVKCFGGNSGCATMTVTGGTQPYFYFWLNNPTPENSQKCGFSASTNNKYEVVDLKGCIDTGRFTILEPTLVTTLMVDTINVCTNDKILIKCEASGGAPSYQYFWSTNSPFNKDTILYTPPNGGINKVKVFAKDAYGCISSIDSVLVIVRPAPVPIITTSDTIGCKPFCVKLYDNGYVPNTLGDYLIYHHWDFGDGFASNDIQTYHCYNNAQTFTVCLTLESSRNCKKKLCKNDLILVHELPENDFKSKPDKVDLLEPLVTFTNDVITNATYYWDFGDGENESSDNSISKVNHKYQDTGSFKVKLITQSEFGCIDTTEHLLIVNPFFTFYIPTAFTPNGDSRNQKFVIQGQSLKDFELILFDRYGTQIFKQSGIDEANSWDGGNSPEGIYNWQITVTNPEGKKVRKNGYLTLIR